MSYPFEPRIFFEEMEKKRGVIVFCPVSTERKVSDFSGSFFSNKQTMLHYYKIISTYYHIYSVSFMFSINQKNAWDLSHGRVVEMIGISFSAVGKEVHPRRVGIALWNNSNSVLRWHSSTMTIHVDMYASKTMVAIQLALFVSDCPWSKIIKRLFWGIFAKSSIISEIYLSSMLEHAKCPHMGSLYLKSHATVLFRSVPESRSAASPKKGRCKHSKILCGAHSCARTCMKPFRLVKYICTSVQRHNWKVISEALKAVNQAVSPTCTRRKH